MASGELLRCMLQVSKGQNESVERFVVGVWETHLPRTSNGQPSCPILLSDATADLSFLQRIVGEELVDITPDLIIQTKKRVVQIPMDVKRGTTPGRFLDILRGILVRFPEKKRVGVIGHRPHVEMLDNLKPIFKSRIVKSSYFGSGEDRASNEWLTADLDLLIVIGTPRIPPNDIRTRMIQVGLDGDASLEPKWVKRYWRGRTENGEPMDVLTRQYDDAIWQQVYEYDVKSTLQQSLGRARSVLEDGIDAVVVTCEPLSLPLWDETLIEVPETIENAIELVATIGLPSEPSLRSLIQQTLNISAAQAKRTVRELLNYGVIVKEMRAHYAVAPQWGVQ